MAVAGFLRLGLVVTTEHLRIAVIDYDCASWRMVSTLLMNAVRQKDTPTPLSMGVVDAVNYLDPAIWNWIEKARGRGNARGEQLKELLQNRLDLHATQARVNRDIDMEEMI